MLIADALQKLSSGVLRAEYGKSTHMRFFLLFALLSHTLAAAVCAVLCKKKCVLNSRTHSILAESAMPRAGAA